MPVGVNQGGKLVHNNYGGQWVSKKYNPYESTVRLAARFYTTSKKGFSPHPQAQPNPSVMQCIR